MSQPLEVSDPAEGSVNWKGAKEFLTGQSGDAQAGEGEPTLKEFKYRGKAVKVDASTYELLETMRRDARGQNGRLGSELGQARERLARLEAIVESRQVPEASTQPAIKEPDPMLATRDIAAYQRELLAYHAAERERLKAELEEKYLGHVREVKSRVEAGQRETEWANRFYAQYDYLDHPDIKPTVAQVYVEHKDEIDALRETDPEVASERLAELADARLTRIRTVGRGEVSPETNRPPRFESSAGAAPRAKVEESRKEFSAGSWVAKQRLLMAGRSLPKEK